MAAGNNKTNEEQAANLRDLFVTKHAADIEGTIYDERDVEKYKTDDKHVASFIRAYESLQDACDHLHESMKFRNDLGINDLTPESFPIEVWESGAVYFRNHDKDGHIILYVQVKQHRKDPQLLPIIKKFFAYMLEIQSKKHPDEPIVLLFDLAGAGMSQLDMEFVKYIINCFKLYYPKMLEYMLMFEMPWLFNAAWKVIKQMLHAESVKRIKFTTKSDIQEYINKDQLWEHMGGTDKFEYKYDPADYEVDSDTVDSDTSKKKVTFSDQDNNAMFKSVSTDSMKELNGTALRSINTNGSSVGGIMKERRNSAPAQLSPRQYREDNSFIGRFLTICPAEELEFVTVDEASEGCDSIVLKNTMSYSVAFKVKTTSPEKYRVRPSSGVIKAGTETQVNINLQQGYHQTVHRDKFLVMAMELSQDSKQTFSEQWKSAAKDAIMEHRLRCVIVKGKDQGSGDRGSIAGHEMPASTDLAKKVDTLLEQNTRLQKTVQVLVISQVVLTVILLAVIVYWFIFVGRISGAGDFRCNLWP